MRIISSKRQRVDSSRDFDSLWFEQRQVFLFRPAPVALDVGAACSWLNPCGSDLDLLEVDYNPLP